MKQRGWELHLGRAIEVADAALVDAKETPLPEGLTQHSLRHTYISLRRALGHDLATVAQDVGHADMAVTYRIYTHVMRLEGDERDRLRALVEGLVLAPIGTSTDSTESVASGRGSETAL